MGRIPGPATVEGTLDLRAEDHHTAGQIDIEFAIRGRLDSLGGSAFTHKCEELVVEFLSNVSEELEGGPPATDAALRHGVSGDGRRGM